MPGNSIYKILTAIVASKIYQHVTKNNILAWEQNGCRKRCRGCKETLVIDSIVSNQARTRKRNLSVGWIDYQKAFDSVPHTWLIRVLQIYKVNPIVIEFLKNTMANWCTTINARNTNKCYQTELLKIERGIFQGDTLSPLWFCLALNPLSFMLNDNPHPYTIQDSVKLSHQFYVDDLKLYARGKDSLQSLLEIVSKFSRDICMSFGVEKCATLNVRRGKIEDSEYVQLMDGTQIGCLGRTGNYKYLGIEQALINKERENKEKFSKVSPSTRQTTQNKTLF